MTEKHILLPIETSEILSLSVGDIVFLSGILCTGRDQVHKRIFDMEKDKQPLPTEFNIVKGGAIYHMGPIVKQLLNSSYQIVSGGPTTSERMSPYQADVCRILGTPIVIGKGGMKSVNWSKIPAIYLQFPGGAGAIATKFIENVEGVLWLDLGPPEAVWFLRVKNFGPCIVAMDAKGNSLFT